MPIRSPQVFNHPQERAIHKIFEPEVELLSSRLVPVDSGDPRYK